MPSRTVTIVVRALGATNASRQLRGVSSALGSVDRRGRSASRSIRSVGDAASRMRSTAWYATTRVAYGLTAVGAAAAVTGIKFNAMMEQQTVAFTGFLGSTKLATDYVNSLYEIAKNTPFEFQDVLKGTRTLVAYGLAADDARSLFVGMGDAIAATGGGADQIRRATIALGQVQAAGVLHAQDLNQLIQAGVVSLPLLTKRMGTNTKQFRLDMKKNKISSEEFFTALSDSWENDPMYKGAAAKQAKTFNGQMEKLRDTAKQTMGTITEPLFDALRKKGLPALSAFSSDLTEIWKNKKLDFSDKFDLSVAAWHKRMDPLADSFAEWWRSDRVGDKIANAFEDMLVYVGEQTPRMIQRVMGTAFNAWMKMGPAGKAVTAGLLLTKLGITRAVLGGAAGLLMRRVFGGRGGRGRGGGLGGSVGTMTVNAGVVYVNGGVGTGTRPGGPVPPGGKTKGKGGQYRDPKTGRFAKKPSRWSKALSVGRYGLYAADIAAAPLALYELSHAMGWDYGAAWGKNPLTGRAYNRGPSYGQERRPSLGMQPGPGGYLGLGNSPTTLPILGGLLKQSAVAQPIEVRVMVDGREIGRATTTAATRKKAAR